MRIQFLLLISLFLTHCSENPSDQVVKRDSGYVSSGKQSRAASDSEELYEANPREAFEKLMGKVPTVNPGEDSGIEFGLFSLQLAQNLHNLEYSDKGVLQFNRSATYQLWVFEKLEQVKNGYRLNLDGIYLSWKASEKEFLLKGDHALDSSQVWIVEKIEQADNLYTITNQYLKKRLSKKDDGTVGFVDSEEDIGVNNIWKIKKTRILKKLSKPKLTNLNEIGEVCEAGNDCAIDSCTNLQCLDPGKQKFCLPFGANPNGTRCCNDSECQSLHCNSENICAVHQSDILTCNKDSDCDSGFCIDSECKEQGLALTKTTACPPGTEMGSTGHCQQKCNYDQYYDPATDRCSICTGGLELGPNGTCVEACPNSTYRDYTTRHCMLCPTGKEMGPNQVCETPCPPDRYRDPQTLTCKACPEGFELDESKQCVEICGSGSRRDPVSKECVSCGVGFFMGLEQKCIAECKGNEILDTETLLCKRCPDGSEIGSSGQCEALCAMDEFRDHETLACTSCGEWYELIGGVCQAPCSVDQFRGNDGTCQYCPEGEEIGSSGFCEGKCSINQYRDFETRACVSCPEGKEIGPSGRCEDKCAPDLYRDPQTLQCVSCADGLEVGASGSCELACPRTQFRDFETRFCMSCPNGKEIGPSGLCEALCAPDQIRNPVTRQCTSCPDGQEIGANRTCVAACNALEVRDQASDTCYPCDLDQLASEQGCLAQCADNQIRDLSSGQCVSCPLGKEPVFNQCVPIFSGDHVLGLNQHFHKDLASRDDPEKKPIYLLNSLLGEKRTRWSLLKVDELNGVYNLVSKGLYLAWSTGENGDFKLEHRAARPSDPAAQWLLQPQTNNESVITITSQYLDRYIAGAFAGTGVEFLQNQWYHLFQYYNDWQIKPVCSNGQTADCIQENTVEEKVELPDFADLAGGINSPCLTDDQCSIKSCIKPKCIAKTQGDSFLDIGICLPPSERGFGSYCCSNSDCASGMCQYGICVQFKPEVPIWLENLFGSDALLQPFEMVCPEGYALDFKTFKCNQVLTQASLPTGEVLSNWAARSIGAGRQKAHKKCPTDWVGSLQNRDGELACSHHQIFTGVGTPPKIECEEGQTQREGYCYDPPPTGALEDWEDTLADGAEDSTTGFAATLSLGFDAALDAPIPKRSMQKKCPDGFERIAGRCVMTLDSKTNRNIKPINIKFSCKSGYDLVGATCLPRCDAHGMENFGAMCIAKKQSVTIVNKIKPSCRSGYSKSYSWCKKYGYHTKDKPKFPRTCWSKYGAGWHLSGGKCRKRYLAHQYRLGSPYCPSGYIATGSGKCRTACKVGWIYNSVSKICRPDPRCPSGFTFDGFGKCIRNPIPAMVAKSCAAHFNSVQGSRDVMCIEKCESQYGSAFESFADQGKASDYLSQLVCIKTKHNWIALGVDPKYLEFRTKAQSGGVGAFNYLYDNPNDRVTLDGQLPDLDCPGGDVLFAGLCYPPCKEGYERRLDSLGQCTSKCDGSWYGSAISSGGKVEDGCKVPQFELKSFDYSKVKTCPKNSQVVQVTATKKQCICNEGYSITPVRTCERSE